MSTFDNPEKRVYIVVATSSDGFIANDEHVKSTRWTSNDDKAAFRNLTMGAAVVMGSKTYDTLERPYKPLPKRLNVVYSRSNKHEGRDLETTSEKPAELVRKLLGRPWHDAFINKIAIIGGGEIYHMFLEAGVVERIYMTIEPIAFGHGIPFADKGWKDEFKLVNHQKLASGTRFLIYDKKPRGSK